MDAVRKGFDFCYTCGAEIFGFGDSSEGTAVAYMCLAEVFVPPGGPTTKHPVRVLKKCPAVFGCFTPRHDTAA